MKILIAGASGLLGSAVSEKLKAEGWEIVRMVRDRGNLTDETALYNPETGFVDKDKVEWLSGTEGFRAVFNFAGASIGAGRWNDEIKKEIYDSRVKSTELLAKTIANLNVKPQVFISASAIGIYGNRGDTLLDETTEPSGQGFLSRLAIKWEAATEPALSAGIRVVTPRFGLVLSPHGGVLKKMMTMAKIGGAAPLGEGQQWWSWITIDDAVNALIHIMKDDRLSGPVNVANTNPMRNENFSRSLQVYFNAPIHMHIPVFMLKLVFGEMAEETLLSSQKVTPVKLRQTGFKFKHEQLEAAVRYLTSERVTDIDKELGR